MPRNINLKNPFAINDPLNQNEPSDENVNDVFGENFENILKAAIEANPELGAKLLEKLEKDSSNSPAKVKKDSLSSIDSSQVKVLPLPVKKPDTLKFLEEAKSQLPPSRFDNPKNIKMEVKDSEQELSDNINFPEGTLEYVPESLLPNDELSIELPDDIISRAIKNPTPINSDKLKKDIAQKDKSKTQQEPTITSPLKKTIRIKKRKERKDGLLK